MRGNEWRISEDGWLETARAVVSPNQDARPAGCAVDLLVIHGISLPPREFGGPWIEALFGNRLDPEAHPYFADIAHLRVSAHVLIRREGELVQFVSFDRRAWHAGASAFRGRGACNDFAIGVELEGADDIAYTEAQYAAAGRLAGALMRHYPGIGADRIVGHSDIAPERKTDPGPAFDWQRFRKRIAAP